MIFFLCCAVGSRKWEPAGHDPGPGPTSRTSKIGGAGLHGPEGYFQAYPPLSWPLWTITSISIQPRLASSIR